MTWRLRLRRTNETAFAALSLLVFPSLAVADLEAECRAAQVRDIGAYGRCRLEVARAAADTGRAPDYGACETAFAKSWSAQLPEGGCEQYASDTVTRSIRPATTAP